MPADDQPQQQDDAGPVTSLAGFEVDTAGRLPPGCLFLIQEAVTQQQEGHLLSQINASQAKWVQLSGRRLQNHGGTVHAKGLIPAALPRWLEGLVAAVHARAAPLFGEAPPNHVLINSYPPGCGIMPHEDGPLYHPVVAILSLGFPAVLRFWSKQPEGGTGGLPPVASVLLMPRSLLVFLGDAYCQCLHGIEEVAEELLDASVVNALPAGRQQQQLRAGTVAEGADAEPAGAAGAAAAGAAAAAGPMAVVPREGERVSLTIRRVLRVHKALGLLGGRRV